MTEFEATLYTAPNRFNALSGAARAAKLSGNDEKAKSYYAQLLANCEHADGDRPDLQDARSLFAENKLWLAALRSAIRKLARDGFWEIASEKSANVTNAFRSSGRITHNP
jgi:hypothetical protein